ncbi:hypothetical protein IV01_00010, partial [Pseudomonas syringae]
SGASCRVIVSGGNPQRHETSEADNYLPYLLQRQVPRADIVLENDVCARHLSLQQVGQVVVGLGGLVALRVAPADDDAAARE